MISISLRFHILLYLYLFWKLIFAAKKLDADTTRGKTAFERAKAQLNKAKKKLSAIEDNKLSETKQRWARNTYGAITITITITITILFAFEI